MTKHVIFPLLIAVIVVLIVFLGMGLKPFTSSQEMVFVRVGADKSTYSSGEEVKITFSLVNDSPNEISVPSLGYNLEIIGSQGTVLIVTETRISSQPVGVDGSSQTFVGTYVWNQKDVNGHQVPGGVYTVHVRLLDAPYHGAATIKIE